MRTVGVDLSAEPKKTAVAVINWQQGHAEVDKVVEKCSDEMIIELCNGADKVGIDCPLGWPEPFIDFVTAHRDRGPLAAHDLAGRRNLAYRATDLAVIASERLRPLSVSADRIGHAAMRAAGLLAALARAGHDVDRAGRGVVVEAYPAAALRRWKLPHNGYKGVANRAARERLTDLLSAAVPWLDFSVASAECCASDDALDAVVCALIARAACLGKVTSPNEAQAHLAATEGWIAVPRCQLAELASDL